MRPTAYHLKVIVLIGYCLIAIFFCTQFAPDFSGTLTTALHPPPVREPYKDFCVHPNVFRSNSSWSFEEFRSTVDADRVTLVLHLSADYLNDRLLEQVMNWDAPVSLAIYFSHPKEQFTCVNQKLLQMHDSAPSYFSRLHVHYFYKGSCRALNVSATCESRNATSIQEIAEYPVNVARNIARKYVRTNYIVIADYEHLFSIGFERKMAEIAKRELSGNKKTLLVYRIFEIDDSVPSPRNKAELAELIKDKKAIVFHARYYHGAHEIPGLQQWLRKPSNKGDGIFARNLAMSRSNWEPQFVSASSIPLHDEHFPYMIRDNTCLRWELCRANYSLVLVDDHFMFHRGIKTTKAGGIGGKIKRMNRKKFNEALAKFTLRMMEEYPKTISKCPQFKF